MCIKLLKRKTNAHERRNVLLLLSDHRNVSVTDGAGHLQGGNSKNAITIIMCRNQSTVKSHVILIKFTVKILSYRWVQNIER
jgi:hypothetical protein